MITGALHFGRGEEAPGTQPFPERESIPAANLCVPGPVPAVCPRPRSRDGLPITSAHMESLVKEIGYRVKGTEKFWNEGGTAKAILQIHAATLCEDDRFEKYLAKRLGNPFRPNVKIKPAINAAA
jgi:hypothetical protein